MRKEGFCAYGARYILNLIREEALPSPNKNAQRFFPKDALQLQETLHCLQTCLSLFHACYPPTRIAFWRSAIRRVLRALYALERHHWLDTQIRQQAWDTSAQSGVARIQLRLRQQRAPLLQRIQQTWQRLQETHVCNEIMGYSKRWIESFSEEAVCQAYTRQRWRQFIREHLPALHETGADTEVRWGRVRTLITAGEILEPILGESLVPDEWHQIHHQLNTTRLTEYAQRQIAQIITEERERTLHYYGHLRPFAKMQKGFEALLNRFETHTPQENSSSEKG